MQVLNTILSSRPDYLVALQSAPKMPLPPPPPAPAPVQITPIVQQTMPNIPPMPPSSGSKSYSKTFRNLIIGGIFGLVAVLAYKKYEEYRERKRFQK